MLKAVESVCRQRIPTFFRWGHVLWDAIVTYSTIDGEQRAASFAYYAFFSIFPLLLLLTTVGSVFLNPVQVQEKVLDTVDEYVPLSANEQMVVRTVIVGFIEQRGRVSLVALLGVAWTSLRFFQALVRGINRAWGTVEYSWWRLPIKNLLMVAVMASALMVGIFAPMLLTAIEEYWRRVELPWASALMAIIFMMCQRLIPLLVLFFGLTLFYKLAPRGQVPLRYVWVPAIMVTILLQWLQWLFVLYAKNFGKFNVIYGTFGGAIALLTWIYLSGSVIIFGGCVSAAIADHKKPAEARAEEEEKHHRPKA